MPLPILRAIGLSDGEAKVYQALLDLGPAPAGRIHEKAGMERRNVYDILSKLIEKGLVAYVEENGRKAYSLGHPNRLLGYLDERGQELARLRKKAEKEMPSLLERFSARRPEINAQAYRGKDGIKAVWDDMLNHKEILWIGSGRYVPKKMPHFFAAWNRRRVKLGIKWRNLLRHELRGKTRLFAHEQARFLPPEFSASPAVIAIYGEKVVNFLLGEDYFAFVVESRELAESYRRYHKYLWEKIAAK
ncbi:MAG: hypothetical protein HY519_00340 [Candidatus Aenigmarchaeota archaeon]|nr:hypothetical protein [Candidatus Aenigmarchaeota archaeon]